jgi:hypothetical protein
VLKWALQFRHVQDSFDKLSDSLSAEAVHLLCDPYHFQNRDREHEKRHAFIFSDRVGYPEPPFPPSLQGGGDFKGEGSLVGKELGNMRKCFLKSGGWEDSNFVRI